MESEWANPPSQPSRAPVPTPKEPPLVPFHRRPVYARLLSPDLPQVKACAPVHPRPAYARLLSPARCPPFGHSWPLPLSSCYHPCRNAVSPCHNHPCSAGAHGAQATGKPECCSVSTQTDAIVERPLNQGSSADGGAADVAVESSQSVVSSFIQQIGTQTRGSGQGPGQREDTANGTTPTKQDKVTEGAGQEGGTAQQNESSGEEANGSPGNAWVEVRRVSQAEQEQPTDPVDSQVTPTIDCHD